MNDFGGIEPQKSFWNAEDSVPYESIETEQQTAIGHKKAAPASRLSWDLYFFMWALTMASTSSGVSMGLAISFLGHTAAQRPQEVQRS